MSAMMKNTGSRIRTIAAALLATGAIATVFAADAVAAEDLVVKYDQSMLLRLPRPPQEIIIGNPTIADVTVQAGGLLIVTGKTFGVTNIIALDNERNVIQDQRVVVQRDEARIVNLQKGGKRESYNCTPQCNPTITVGDDNAYFDQVTRSSERKVKFSEGASDSGGANAQ